MKKFSPGNFHDNKFLRLPTQLTYICHIDIESRLMTIHIEVMIHDQWWLNQSTAMIVQWKLVCHRTMATLNLRHYHVWKLILEFFFNFVFVQKNSSEVFCINSSLSCCDLIFIFLFYLAEGTFVKSLKIFIRGKIPVKFSFLSNFDFYQFSPTLCQLSKFLIIHDSFFLIFLLWFFFSKKSKMSVQFLPREKRR